MEKQKMTIHRGLVELKLIDSRISKAINSIEPTGMMQSGKPVNGFVSEEEFIKDVKSKYNSITDLITRKNKIKSAIVKANSSTIIKVAGEEMSIADAISYKNIIEQQKLLVSTLLRKHNSVKGKFITENESVSNKALENAKIILGKEGDNKVKTTDEDIKNIVEPYLNRNKYILVDPLNVDKLTDELQNKIDSFECEIDSILSEVNAVTFIEV